MVMKKGLTVTGTVRNGKGEPVEKANVSRNPNKRVVSWYKDVKTDAQGRFKFSNVPPGPLVITTEAKGYSPNLRVLNVSTQPAPMDIMLDRGHTIRVRVVDVQGEPLEGVWAWSRHWRGYASWMHDAKTGKDGRFAMDSAPDDEVIFEMGKEGYIQIWDQPVTAGDEQVLTMRRELKIRGKVKEADTGKPVTRFRMIPGFPWHRGEEPFWDKMHAKTMPGSEYECTFSFPRDGYAVRIEAEGYSPAVSPVYNGEEVNVTCDFELEAALPQEGIHGTVKDSRGRPVSGATVALATSQRPVYLQNGHLLRDQDYASAVTDARGGFSIPAQRNLTGGVVLADEGFAVVAKSEFAETVEIALEAWGRVEGTMKIGARPAVNETAVLTEVRPPGFSGRIAWFDYRAGVGDGGRFSIERVPPGDYRIARQVIFNETGNGYMTGATSSVEFQVEAGKTARITVGGTGRPIIGRVAPPSNAKRQLDFSYGAHTLIDADAGRFPFKLNADGSFRVEDVPEGEYDLSINVQQRPADRSTLDQATTLATVRETVTVPAIPGGRSDAPLDLGTLKLTMNADDEEEKPATRPGPQK
jgi:hypothetical protein